MAETALTDSSIEAALGDPKRVGRVELADTAESGLRLRITTTSALWSVLARGATGQRMRLPLGAWPAMGVDQARKTAGALKTALSGIAAPEDEDGSVGHVLRRYQTRRLSQLRKGAVMGRALAAAMEPLKHRPIKEVARREISMIIDDKADHAPVHANRVLAYTKAFFTWAVGRGYIETSVAAAIAKPTRERARERTPTLKEVAEIWVAAGQLGYPFGPIVRLLILTAARRDEIGAMRTTELNLDGEASAACWIIPAARSKNGRAIRSPLSPLARQTLAEALEASPEAGFVFTTTGRSSVSGWSRAKTRLDALLAAGRVDAGREAFEPWRFHDLRRSFATSACDLLHIDPIVVDRCLNHVGAGTTSTVSRIYARNELFDQRRDALTKWSARVDEAVKAARLLDVQSPVSTPK